MNDNDHRSALTMDNGGILVDRRLAEKELDDLSRAW